MTDVVDLGMEKRKRARKNESPGEKLTIAQMCDLYTEIINKSYVIPGKPFPHDLYVLTNSRAAKSRTIVQRNPITGEVTPKELDEVEEMIVSFGRDRDIQAAAPGLLVTNKRANEAAKFWRACARRIPTPPPTRWLDETGDTFRRLPWPLRADPSVNATPTWNGLLKRMSNREAFIAWLGSLLHKDSYLQQYVWIFGHGDDGKGAINRFLERVFGQAYRSTQAPEKDQKRFWAADLPGARVVVFPDCNNWGFVAGGFFKTLTGGDPIRVEEKYEKSKVEILFAKYLFLSNEMPQISSEKADMRRIIFCEMEPRDGEVDVAFEDKLYAEGGTFLSNCLAFYDKTYPNHGVINQESKGIQNWVSVVEEPYEVLVEENFVIEPFEGKPSEAPYTLARDMAVLMDHYFKVGGRLAFMTWLKKKYNVTKHVVTPSGAKSEKRYLGVILTPRACELIAAIRNRNTRIGRDEKNR